MKLKLRLALAGALLVAPLAQAQLTVPGANGSDGAFNPATASVLVDLGLANTSVWSNSPAVAGRGVYDPDQWAVVYKYSSVNIPATTTITFSNHPAMAPVVWLVNGNVTNNGTINISGQDNASGSLSFAQGGPGGFRGALRTVIGDGAAFGPGAPVGGGGSSASYSTVGYQNPTVIVPGSTYGSSTIIPLIGGSGGLSIGSGGGGALLICATGTITINGQILARGGSNNDGFSGRGCGSGGAVRLVCNVLQGGGIIVATGGSGYGFGGQGRIRIECNTFSGGVTTVPSTIAVPPSNPAKLWPDSAAPRVEIASVAGLATPVLISASMDLPSADIAFTNTTAVEVVINSFNLPVNSAVTLQVAPKNSSGFRTNAAFFSGNLAAAVWKVTIPSVNGFAAMQVRAVSP